jgi:hypothetical protein
MAIEEGPETILAKYGIDFPCVACVRARVTDENERVDLQDFFSGSNQPKPTVK